MSGKLIFLSVALLIFLGFTSCDRAKENEEDELSSSNIIYKNMGDVEIAFNKSISCDVDDDGINDFTIGSQKIISTSEQSTNNRYFFTGSFRLYSPIDNMEQTRLLSVGDIVSENNFPTYEWFNSSKIILVEKVIPLSGNIFWKGEWRDVSHMFMAFAVEKNEKRYYGWLELSFSKEKEAVILHRSAISSQAETSITIKG